MTEISQIVDYLNQPPFSRDLRLVEFDEKSPLELIAVLNDVFAAIDPQQSTADARDEPEDARSARLMGFLQMLKFEIAPDQYDAFAVGLGAGDKGAVYPVLHWVLQRLPQLQKRAYLARYLMPLNVPAEFLQDPALVDLLEAYRGLQSEFKGAHKAVDALRRTDLRPAELRSEITQLEDEKRQLKEKIARVQRAAAEEPGFAEMFEVTARLRRAQEEEARLSEREREQRSLLGQAESRLEEASKRLQALKATSAGGHGTRASAEAVLGQLQQEVTLLTQKATSVLPSAAATASRALQRCEREAAEPARSADDVQHLRELANGLTRECAATKAAADAAVASRGDANLAMFRQQASLAAAKLEEKAAACEALSAERSKLARELEDKEGLVAVAAAAAAAGSGNNSGGGGSFMSREQFKAYGAKLREKTGVYKQLKAELGELRAESVVLNRTEQVLKGRDDKLEEFLQKLESDKGVTGYRKAHADLVSKSEATAAVDASKAETLEEISALVNTITQELKSRKERLRPLIEALKEARREAQEVDAEHSRRRGAYEKIAVGLEVERSQLEQECDSLQSEALQEESRYHTLAALKSIADARVLTVDQEARWQAGDGRLLPDFKCLKDLYEHKLRQQEGLSKGLRRQQRTIKETEGPSTLQRKMFSDLQALLKCKLDTKQRARAAAAAGGGSSTGGGGYGGRSSSGLGADEAYLKAMDAQFGGGGGSGGLNVMTIDQM